MRTVCPKDMCAGCMACISICKKDAIKIQDSLNSYNAIIDSKKCIDCGACENVCQVNRQIEPMRKPKIWYQGWATEEQIREKSSSGGAATSIMRAFIKEGGLVCSCSYCSGNFGFLFAENLEEIDRFTGSKYVKSNPQGIYDQLKEYLKNGKKVLFLGLPCQVAAVKNYVGDKLLENLYTVDLICHGTPSPKVFDIFLQQYGKKLEEQISFKFRDKDMFQVAASGEYIVHKGAADCYSIAFLNSLIYTENCYSCQYACLNRISDITLGDSWGSELEVSECKKGLSLVLVQTEKGREILNKSKMHLEDVDLNKAVAANHQLSHPSARCKNSPEFWECLKMGKKFNYLVWRRFSKICMRQSIKCLLLKMNIIHR